jgi:hypothetical protein
VKPPSAIPTRDGEPATGLSTRKATEGFR